MSSRLFRLARRTAILYCLAFSLDSFGEAACPNDEVVAHVRAQLRIYGPMSLDREYFGFIYREGGVVKSSVTQGMKCRYLSDCGLDTREAARGIPGGAKVLGEWHSHPTWNGSNVLSWEDVRGAWRNRNIRCYTPYYAAADGSIYSWEPTASSVVVAMESRVLLDNYRQPANEPAEARTLAANRARAIGNVVEFATER